MCNLFLYNTNLLSNLYHKDFYTLVIKTLPNLLKNYYNPCFISISEEFKLLEYNIIYLLFIYPTSIKFEIPYSSVNLCIKLEKTFSLDLYIKSEFMSVQKSIRIPEVSIEKILVKLFKSKTLNKKKRKKISLKTLYNFLNKNILVYLIENALRKKSSSIDIIEYLFIKYKKLKFKLNLNNKEKNILFILNVFKNTHFYTLDELDILYKNYHKKQPTQIICPLNKAYHLIREYLFKYLSKKNLIDNIKVLYTILLFLCRLPMLTANGTFIINGLEKVFIYKLNYYPGIFTTTPSESIDLNFMCYSLIIRSNNNLYSKLFIQKNLKTNLFTQLFLQFNDTITEENINFSNKNNMYFNFEILNSRLSDQDIFLLKDLLLLYDIHFFELI